MKNAKIILLILIGVILFCGYGCGGGGGGVDSEGNYEPEDEQAADEAVASLLAKVLAVSDDGSPMIFDYAPKLESTDVGAAAASEKLHFVKYISSKDLNSDDEYITPPIHLNEGSGYIIKYSHNGQTLTNSLLGVRIIAPDNNEMILNIASSDSLEILEDIISDGKVFDALTEDEITELIEASVKYSEDVYSPDIKLTLEDLEAEFEEYVNTSKDYYVPADIEIFPEENPCMIMYVFKAPMTGDYKFALSELSLLSEDEEAGQIFDSSLIGGYELTPDELKIKQILDSPFEFRVYSPEAAHSVSDGEEIELTARDIVAIQRILLDFATEFNENGLPVSFESYESYVDDESEVETSLINGRWVMLSKRQIAARRRKQKRRANYVTVDPVINNVPYDEIFAQGAGFHAHTGLRALRAY